MSKKNPFHPLTVGYDWEMAVLKDTTESAGETEIKKIANEIRRQIPWTRAGMDIDLLEVRMEIIADWHEFKEKNRMLIDCARKISKRKGFIILPIGARPTEQMPIGSHIHIGTIADFTDATRIANAMIKYVPCFVALACNSPFSRFDMGEFKSYRIIYNAEWCSFPNEMRIPRLARGGWGEDVQVRLPRKPTIEIRCLDSASDINLMEEYVVLLAGLFYGVGKRAKSMKEEKDIMKWQSINRFRAAKDGLQAIFHWNGEEKPVTEIFSEIFFIAQEGLEAFGASLDDLEIIQKMLKKKQTQSDFLLTFIELDRDPPSLLRIISNVLSKGDAFKVYLKKAKRLPLKKPLPLEDFILSKITKDVPYFHLYLLSPLPPFYLNRILTRFEKEGRITYKVLPYEGKVYSRTDLI